MKAHQKFWIVAILAVAALIPVASAQAVRISIDLGDRPYYTRGPSYYERGSQFVWIPGHWAGRRHHWVHGHYARRDGRLHRGRVIRFR